MMVNLDFRGPSNRYGSELRPDHTELKPHGSVSRTLCEGSCVMLSRPVKLWRLVTSTGPSADITKKQVPLASCVSSKYILMYRGIPDRMSKKPATVGSPLSLINSIFSRARGGDKNFHQFSVATQGSTMSIPIPLKSRTFRVINNAARERHMAAIWQSASPIGRPLSRRSAAISA